MICSFTYVVRFITFDERAVRVKLFCYDAVLFSFDADAFECTVILFTDYMLEISVYNVSFLRKKIRKAAKKP